SWQRGNRLSKPSNPNGGQPPERQRALAEAMAHPVRSKLLAAITEKSELGVSIRQLSLRIGEPQRRVRYHLDALLDLGLVGIAARRSRRGVVERFYRAEQAPMLTTEQVNGYDESQARQISVQILRAILGDASWAMGEKVFGLRP